MLLAVKTTLLLVQLRALFDDSAVVGVGGIDGYIVPVADAHNVSLINYLNIFLFYELLQYSFLLGRKTS